MVFKFFDKKSGKSSGIKYMLNHRLANELINQLLENLKKEEFILRKDNIWNVDLPDVELINKCNKGIRYLLCVIDPFGKHA